MTMSTLSSHPQLSGSLTRARRCPNISREHGLGATGTNDSVHSDIVGVHTDDTVLDDEEIASVEADGTSGMDVDVDETVEKQLLTAALVTSIVEMAGTCGGKNNIDGDEATTKSSNGKTLESGEARTAVNLTESTNVLHTGPKTTTNESTFRNNAESLSEEVCAEGSSAPPEYSCAASSPLVVLASGGLPNTNDRTKPSHENRQQLMDEHSSAQPLLLQGKAKSSVRPNVPKPNSPIVPNPLAEIQGRTYITSTLIPNNSKKRFSKKSNSITSASPTRSTLPKSGGSAHLGGQLANIAESMSSQYFQTDGLAALSGSEVTSQGRGRIFSLDLDPSILDFVENVDHLAEKSDSPGDLMGCHDDMSSSKNPPPAVRSGTDLSSQMTTRRDRGFSFEFFSFGISEDEPLPPVPSSKCDVTFHGNRLRGDSIIFDPTSFREGGIHETSALLYLKRGIESNRNPCASPVDPFISPPDRPEGNFTTPSCSLSECTSTAPEQSRESSDPKPQAKVAGSPQVELSKLHMDSRPQNRAKVFSTTASQSFTDTTIHMPHGSDAAAAAVAGMSQITSRPPCDGLSLSHTACPMELLNKGGRIGIYLPEERKARIAKFHSKRKIRIWRKRIKYDCRKKLADSRPRIKGRFVKRSDVDGEPFP